jgi:hypothetical protein
MHVKYIWIFIGLIGVYFVISGAAQLFYGLANALK